MDTQQIVRRLIAIAQSGRYYGKDAFDRERYEEILQLASALMITDREGLYQQLQADTGYATPKVDVRAWIRDERSRVLLVQDKQSQEWSLPGGYAEVNVSPTANVIKEVAEETGLQVTTAQLVGIFDTNLREDIPQPFQYYKCIFKCQVAPGTFRDNLETSAMTYFPLDALPKLSLVRTTPEQLQTLQQLAPGDIYVE